MLAYSDLSDERGGCAAGVLRRGGRHAARVHISGSRRGICWRGAKDSDDDVWQTDPLLSMTSGVADPMDGTAGWRLAEYKRRRAGNWPDDRGAGSLPVLLQRVRASRPANERRAVHCRPGSLQGSDDRVDAGFGHGQWRCGGEFDALRDRLAGRRRGGSLRTPGGGAVRGFGLYGEHKRRRLRERASGRGRADDFPHGRESQFLHGKDHSCKPSYELKEQAVTDTPLLLFDCVLPGGHAEHWSTSRGHGRTEWNTAPA